MDEQKELAIVSFRIYLEYLIRIELSELVKEPNKLKDPEYMHKFYDKIATTINADVSKEFGPIFDSVIQKVKNLIK